MHKDNFVHRFKGAVVGFAIGDSLGYPAAGIRKTDFLKLNSGLIKGFTENKSHPFFYKLKRGQFTDNTRLFALIMESLIKNKGFVQKDILLRLTVWAKSCRDNPNFERWSGKTSLRASLNLLNGVNYPRNSIKSTFSCASIYRTLPIGIFFSNHTDDEIFKYSDLCASYTHNSPVSRGGSIFAASSISKILNGNNLKKAFSSSLVTTAKYSSDKCFLELLKKIKWSLENYKKVKNSEAMRFLGTGSSILQTLPLSIFICLQATSFNNGVLTAANSFREDSRKEKSRMSQFGWTEQLLKCIGGNTDGIGAICGCFLGGLYGLNKIPARYKKVENYSKIIKTCSQYFHN